MGPDTWYSKCPTTPPEDMVPRFLLAVVLMISLHEGEVEGVRMCGRRLADLLNFVCQSHGGFHAPSRVKRDASSKRAILEILRPLSRRTEGEQGGVVDECCRKQCTMATLASYCAKHVGNIDLEEMLPPGSDAISAEDIADYQQMQQQDSKSKAESAEARPHFVHASRPNLGQFMRSRPVFMVLSQQLQEDKDRKLGDYRF